MLAEEALIVEDFASGSRYEGPPLFERHGITSGLSVVVQSGSGPYGVLGACSTRRRTFKTDDVHFLRDIAIEISLAIQRRRVELEQHERDILRAEQMAVVAQIATGVAHEIRNPLTSIKMLVQAGQEEKTGSGLSAVDLGIIEGEIRRMERSLKEFLDFARPPKPERRRFDMRSLVERTYALVELRASQQHVRLEFARPDHAVTVEADWEQIQQLLLNLTLNALDAMPSEGTLSVELDTPTSSRARLRVLDTGPGIAVAILPRLFQPFVTTKDTGIGLGLVVSNRIAEDHGGSLCAHNRPEGGACFVLELSAFVETNG